jgi:hypothetical protein
MCAIDNIFESFVATADTAFDPATPDDQIERYDEKCTYLGWQMADQVAQTLDEGCLKVLLVIYARDHGIGIAACDAILDSFLDDMERVMLTGKPPSAFLSV